ncbi:hypothetical protein GYMLUDRAFT_131415, partial [Collybiopsis luxurians FD-317 M1]
RVRRWNEEVKLLEAEMDRCVRTLQWQKGWWEDRTTVEQFEGMHAEGAAAYASKQATVRKLIADHFQQLW